MADLIPMTQVDDIVADIAKVLRPAIESALARVKDDAKREAAAEFKAKLSAMLDDTSSAVPADIANPKEAPVVHTPIQPSPHKGRASPGTVKPQILDVLQQSPEGISTRDIATLTGFKYNSVRGTLWLLKKEGIAENWDEKWFPARNAGLSSASEPQGQERKEPPEGGSEPGRIGVLPNVFN